MQKNSPLHVLVIPTWYPNGEDKLIGVYHKLFCTALAEYGVKANMLYVDRQGLSSLPKYPTMQKLYEESNTGYVTYCRRMLDISKFSADAQLSAYCRTVEKLYKTYVKQHGKPDILHAHVTVPAGYAAAKLGEKYHIPVVITEHSSYFERFFEGSTAKYGLYAARHSVMTCVSGYMTDILKEKHNIPTEVLPNIVNTKAFCGAKKPKDPAHFRLTTVSALRPGKCVEDALQALKLLREQHPEKSFLYTIVGDGQEEAFYKKTASELGLNDIVSFVGRKTESEIAEILNQTDALLMASDIETFGIPAVEALAAGVPVISTRCKGPESFLNDDCAEFCNVHDPKDMEDAILRMAARSDTLDEAKIRAAAKPFDSVAVAERAVQIYREALENTK